MNFLQKITFFALLSLLLACGAANPETAQSPADAPGAAISVKGVPVEVSKAPLAIQTSGKVAAGAEAGLSVKIGGIVERLYVDEGDVVRKGQVLARIGQPEIGAQVTQAQSGLEKAQRDFARAERLYRDTVITLEQLQNLATARDVAAAQVESASASAGYATLYAPDAGKILRRMAEKGEMAAPGMPLFVMETREKHVTVRAALTDREVVKVNTGDTAHIRLDAWPGQVFRGQVASKGEAADPMTGLFEVELRLDDQGLQIRNGFVAKIEIFPLQQAAYYKIPVDAVVESEGEQLRIYVPTPDRQSVAARSIARYVLEGESLIVPAADLPGLDFVITRGARYVSPGAVIRILDDPLPQGMAGNR